MIAAAPHLHPQKHSHFSSVPSQPHNSMVPHPNREGSETHSSEYCDENGVDATMQNVPPPAIRNNESNNQPAKSDKDGNEPDNKRDQHNINALPERTRA